jgi:hypothetical protein
MIMPAPSVVDIDNKAAQGERPMTGGESIHREFIQAMETA